MSDRHLGYFLLSILLLLILIPAVSLSVHALKPLHKTVVVFPSANTLNFLRKQDQVKVRGVKVGTIQEVCRYNNETCVAIATGKKLSMYQGYRIVAEVKGFMGDRYLEIDPGDPSRPAIKREEELIGEFPLGPVEAIARADSLRGKIRNLLNEVEELRTGTPSHYSFVQRFRNGARTLDTMSANLRLILGRADTVVSTRLDTLTSYLGKAGVLSANIDNSVCRAESTVEAIETRSRAFLRAADSITSSLAGQLQLLRTPEAEALNRVVDSAKMRVEDLTRLTEQLRRQGIKAKL